MITSNAEYLYLLTYSNFLSRIINLQDTTGIQSEMLEMPLAWAQLNFSLVQPTLNVWIAAHPSGTSGVSSGGV